MASDAVAPSSPSGRKTGHESLPSGSPSHFSTTSSGSSSAASLPDSPSQGGSASSSPGDEELKNQQSRP